MIPREETPVILLLAEQGLLLCDSGEASLTDLPHNLEKTRPLELPEA